jgi:hypothetical protein
MCSNSELSDLEKLKAILQHAFTKLGGNSKRLPCVFNFVNGDVSQALVGGGIADEKLAVILEYVAESPCLQIRLFSKDKISESVIMPFLSEKFNGCSIEVVNPGL